MPLREQFLWAEGRVPRVRPWGRDAVDVARGILRALGVADTPEKDNGKSLPGRPHTKDLGGSDSRPKAGP